MTYNSDMKGSDTMKNLKELRKAKDLTQSDMAKKLGVGRTAYTEYERGRNQPSIEKLKIMAEIFECSVDDLIGNEKNTNSSDIEELAMMILGLPDEKRKQAIDFINFLKGKE